jgi:hypothetical protein
MKKYFNTQEKALKHLEYRKKCAYDRIEKRKDKVLGDASCVICIKDKWMVMLQILTQNLLEDIMSLSDVDVNESKPLIPFSIQEKMIKKELKIRQLEKKYKTLDIEEYTINKQL